MASLHGATIVDRQLAFLRDSPVDNDGASDAVLAGIFTYLMAAPPDPSDGRLHWFCGRALSTTVAAATFLIRLFAYSSHLVDEWRSKFRTCLTGCPECVQGLEEAKATSKTTYLAAFSADVLTGFYQSFEAWELSTVLEDMAAQPLAAIAPAIGYRIVCNLTILQDPQIMSSIHRAPPTSPIHCWPSDPIPPGILILLMDEELDVRKWAEDQASLAKAIPISTDRFSTSHLMALDVIIKVLDPVARSTSTTPFSFAKDPQTLWSAFWTVLTKVPVEFLLQTETLYRVVKGHLHDAGSHLSFILRCFEYLARLFWPQAGPHYPHFTVSLGPSNNASTDAGLQNSRSIDISRLAHLRFKENRSEPEVVNVRDICQRLDDLFHEDKEAYNKFLASRGTAAQELLDLLQNLLDVEPNLPSLTRRRIFQALIRLSRHCKLYPQCYTLVNLEQGRLVAGGTFGDVYKGLLNGKCVAVKMMRVFEESDVDTLLKEFGREALIWGQFSHPNLLPFFGLYHFQHRLCLVSPWMENGHLRAFLKKQPSDNNRLLSFILDVALGLEHLHEEGVVHGDLKGDNIFVTPSCRACIGDFGFSSIITSESSIQFTNSSKPSQGGTIRYQAPELHRGGHHDLCSDVYAFACVAYEIVAGNPPFPKLRMDGAVINAVLGGCQPSRPESCSGSPLLDALWDTVQSCWDKEPAKRPTAAEVVRRLRGPNIQAKTMPSTTDWDETFTSTFRRNFLGQWHLPSVAELERVFGQ